MITVDKQQKKKDREKQVKKKLLIRRTKIRQESKERRLLDNEEKATRHKLQPISAVDVRKAQRLRDMEIMSQIEHNQEILKQLEDDYIKENGSQETSFLEQVEASFKKIEEKLT